MSGFFSSIGGFLSDIWDKVPDVDYGNLFDSNIGPLASGSEYGDLLKDEAKGGGGWGSSFLGDIFSPANIAGAVTAYGSSSLKNSQASDSFSQQKELLALKQANDVELLKLRAELDKGSGGGGGGASAALQAAREQIAYNQKRDALNAKLSANQGRVGAVDKGTDQVLQALRTMIDAGQRPLI